MKSLNFLNYFPHTKALLEKATPQTFPSYCVGVQFGKRIWLDSGGAAEIPTLFDLASLTKPLATATCTAIAVQKRILRIDDPVSMYITSFPSPAVTLSHLLDHTSGLEAWKPLFEKLILERFPQRARSARDYFEKEICSSWIQGRFNGEALYSDLGYILLGWCLEIATSRSLDALFQEWISTPLRYQFTQFIPVHPNVAPTEQCPWRGRMLRGEVHDENCFALGGVAGHAGLFGTVSEVLDLASQWLPDSKILSTETINLFWNTRNAPKSPRCLGWDGVSPEGSSSGKYFDSKKTRGHLGFTGTSVWIDPSKSLIVVLLTNRVCPTRANEGMKTLRPLFHDTLLSEISNSSLLND